MSIDKFGVAELIFSGFLSQHFSIQNLMGQCVPQYTKSYATMYPKSYAIMYTAVYQILCDNAYCSIKNLMR